MFFQRIIRRQNPRDGNDASFIRSPYTNICPAGYKIPESVLHEMEEGMTRLMRECIAHNLIDEFTVEEMEQTGEFFLDHRIHLMFEQVRNDLYRQKIIMEQLIETVETVRKAELFKQRKRLQLMRRELSFCIERWKDTGCSEFEMEVQDYGNSE